MILSTSERIANTPWLVYALAIYIIRINYLATKPTIVNIQRLLLVPIFFTLVAAVCFSLGSPNPVLFTAFWSIGFGLGFYAGWQLYKRQEVKVIKNTRQLYRPGTWGNLIILMVAIILQFISFIIVPSHPEWQKETAYMITWVLTYGFFTGLFIGRFAYSHHCLKVGPFISREEAILQPK